MLEVQNEEILNEKDLNIVRRRSKKKQILLYDTQRRSEDFLMKLKYRNNGKYKDIPHYLIDKSGVIHNFFDEKYSSITFNDPRIDKVQIKIALENLGWLNKNTITGVLYNWINDPYRLEPHIKKWRGYFFWDKYTEEQYKSLTELCLMICEKHRIPYVSAPDQVVYKDVIKFNGIVCKSNFDDIYSDINPSFDLKIFSKYDKNQGQR